MDRLSSCYFCGTALDAALDEYPAVPKALGPAPDDQATVVLCDGCREKLATVVERVVTAAGADGDVVADERDQDGTPRTGVGDPPTVGGNDAADAAEDSAVGHEQEGRVERDDAGAGERGEAGTVEGGQDGAGERGEDDAGEGDRNAGGSETRDADVAAGRPDETAPGDAADGNAPHEQAPDDEPSMTALEYNKVMRLLQNREFPVDRAEIRAVATNAYQISESEFDAVIEAAVDRGLIAEEDGQFVSSE